MSGLSSGGSIYIVISFLSRLLELQMCVNNNLYPLVHYHLGHCREDADEKNLTVPLCSAVQRSAVQISADQCNAEQCALHCTLTAVTCHVLGDLNSTGYT